MIMIGIAVAVLSALSLIFGLVLGYASKRFAVKEDPIVERLEALLPQSQCGQCGYAGCRPYAEAVANNAEQINRCAPGGEAVMQELAATLNIPLQPLGDDIPAVPERKIARIDETNCIGCTKCIQACPVDAIIGATRSMHTVMASLCTGCDLCVAPCPTACITLQTVAASAENWKWDLKTIAVQNIPVDYHA